MLDPAPLVCSVARTNGVCAVKKVTIACKLDGPWVCHRTDLGSPELYKGVHLLGLFPLACQSGEAHAEELQRLEEAFDRIEETILPCIAMMLDTLLDASANLAETDPKALAAELQILAPRQARLTLYEGRKILLCRRYTILYVGA